MKFLALMSNLCKPSEPKGTLSIATSLAIPKPVQYDANPSSSIQQRTETYQAPAYQQQTHNVPAARQEAWEEPKRIRRLRDLARLGAYGDAQVEGLKLNGMFAGLALKVYDGIDAESQEKFVAMPMPALFNLVNKIHMQGGVS